MKHMLNEDIAFRSRENGADFDEDKNFALAKLRNIVSTHPGMQVYKVFGIGFDRQNSRLDIFRISETVHTAFNELDADNSFPEVIVVDSPDEDVHPRTLMSKIDAAIANAQYDPQSCSLIVKNRGMYTAQKQISILTFDSLKAVALVFGADSQDMTSNDIDKVNDIVLQAETYFENTCSTGEFGLEYMNQYLDFLVGERRDIGTYSQLNDNCTSGPLLNPQSEFFKEWWGSICVLMAFFKHDDKLLFKQLLVQKGFQLEDANDYSVMKVVGYTPRATTRIIDDGYGWSRYSNWYSAPNRTYMLGRIEQGEFANWWNAQPDDLKDALLGQSASIKYRKFEGTLNDSDSTVRRVNAVAWSNTTKDLIVYGKITLPRKRKEYTVVYAFRTEIFNFIPFYHRFDGNWHGHLYSFRNNQINNSRYGMRILYDPDGYLNDLYAERPNGVTLHGAGPGVPQTIGNNVTEDLTQGVQRRQMHPLTPQQQAAIDAAAQAAAARQQADQEEAARHATQIKQTAQQIQQSLPDVFKRPEFKNLIYFWQGTNNAQARESNRPPFRIDFPLDGDGQYVVINFPGTSNDMFFYGKDRVRQQAQMLGIEDLVQPILDLIEQRLPQAIPVLQFNNNIA